MDDMNMPAGDTTTGGDMPADTTTGGDMPAEDTKEEGAGMASDDSAGTSGDNAGSGMNA